MNPPTIARNEMPWYRDPWPWILMSGPAVVVVAGFITLYIAIVNVDPLVVDQYYKEGLAINRVLERDHEALSRGYRATIFVNEERTLVKVQIAGELQSDELRLHFAHPAKAALDREFTLKPVQAGVYQSPLQLAPAKRWHVELEDAKKQWRLTGSWDPANSSFVLEPRR
ncbi:MAG: FixH family protein [Betaproteobacteria bacterium]